MKTDRAKSIDGLYDEVKDYDLVLSVEAPLVDALNSRIEDASLGTFAITPKRLVYQESKSELMDKRDLFHFIVRKTNMGWKQASYLLENAISCWMETGSLEKILEYERFGSEDMERVIELLNNTKNIFKGMDEFKVQEKNVAVVGIHQFRELDKKVLPENYDIIDIFEDGKVELPKFNIFSSEIGIVRALRENIDQENAGNIAIVMEPESRYQPLVETMLDSIGVSYLAQRELTESLGLRNFLSLCRSINTGNAVKVREVQPVLHFLDIEVSMEYNDQYMKDLELDGLNEFEELMEEMQDSTFEEVLEGFEEIRDEELEDVRDILKELELINENVTERRLDLLEFYLDVFEVPVEEEKGNGVLFVSPKSVAWVDRPNVFQIGMNSSWTGSVPEKPWIDAERHEERNVKNFKILLQNEESHYLVQDNYLNEDVTPCFYFNEIVDREFESFSDFKHEKYNQGTIEEKEAFDKQDYGIDVEEIEMISQSSLNRFVECPRNYFFSKLIALVDRDFFRKGNLFHDFAEFYVNYPELVKDKKDEIIDLMVEEMRPIVDDLEVALYRTEFVLGTERIIKYLEERGFESFDPSGYTKRDRKNFFSEEMGKPIEKKITEAWFENPELGAKGKVDLIKDKKHLLDYKSGRKSSEKGIIKKSNLDLMEDRANFQAMMYLSHLRRKHPGEKLKFTFFYFLDGIDDEMAGRGELEDSLSTINYFPKRFENQVKEKETYNWMMGTSKKRSEFLRKLGYEGYRKIFEEFEASKNAQYSKYEMIKENISDLERECKKHFEIGYGEDYTEKQLKNQCKGVLKKLVEFRKQNYFKEDLDSFEKFLSKKIDELNKCKKTKFPVGDVDLDRVDNRDLILLED